MMIREFSLCRNSDNNARSCISVRTVTIIRLEGRTHRVALIYGRNNNEETRQKAYSLSTHLSPLLREGFGRFM